ncbi:MAG: hypothetical protein V4606_02850 [Patescibacteria group bacterium]
MADTTLPPTIEKSFADQAYDKQTLEMLNLMAAKRRDEILSSRPSFLPLTPDEMEGFQLYVDQTNHVLVRMKKRGRLMFETIEQNYESACTFETKKSFLCKQAKAQYKKIVIETITFGGFYYKISVNSEEVASILTQQ